jgi:head-tail adaptor
MARTFDPARLKTRLTLEEPVATPDGQGGESVAFEPIAVLHAAIEAVDAIVEARGGRMACLTRHRLTIRALSDIAPGMRLVRPGRVLTVKAVLATDDGRYMIIDAEEEAP